MVLDKEYIGQSYNIKTTHVNYNSIGNSLSNWNRSIKIKSWSIWINKLNKLSFINSRQDSNNDI